MTFSETINELFDKEKWTQARQLLQNRLQREPDNHWLLTRLGTTYYEEGDYATALSLSKKAYKLAPKCPLVLWDLASTYEMLEEDHKAIKIYRDIFCLPLEENDEACVESKGSLRSLLADCLYSVAGILHRLRNDKLALWFIQQYFEWLARGAKSIYLAKDAKGLFRKIVGALPSDVFKKGPSKASRKLAHV